MIVKKSSTFITILLVCLLLVSAVYIHYCSASAEEFAMSTSNPTIFGVPIQDKTGIFMAGATQSGMATPDLVLGTQWFKGKDAYDASVAAIADTLEMDQTQDFVRHHLASTMSSYVPPDGIPVNDGLWYVRDYLRNLKQPGLVPYVLNKNRLQEYGF